MTGGEPPNRGTEVAMHRPVYALRHIAVEQHAVTGVRTGRKVRWFICSRVYSVARDRACRPRGLSGAAQWADSNDTRAQDRERG